MHARYSIRSFVCVVDNKEWRRNRCPITSAHAVHSLYHLLRIISSNHQLTNLLIVSSHPNCNCVSFFLCVGVSKTMQFAWHVVLVLSVYCNSRFHERTRHILRQIGSSASVQHLKPHEHLNFNHSRRKLCLRPLYAQRIANKWYKAVGNLRLFE